MRAWTHRLPWAVLMIAAVSSGCGDSVSQQVDLQRRLTQVHLDLNRLSIQLKVYRAHVGDFPAANTPEAALEALVRAPDPAAGGWRGPYVKPEQLLDPWGRPYRYRYPAQHQGLDPFDLWSVGPDGVDGTEDDIGNWQIKRVPRGPAASPDD